VTHYYLVALPAVAVGIVLGTLAAGRMDARTFLRCVHLGLVVVGGLLLLQTLL